MPSAKRQEVGTVNIFSSIVATLFFAAIAAAAALLCGFLVLAGGHVLSRFFPISLVEASALLLGAVFTIGIVANLSRINDSIRARTILGNAEWDERDEDEFEEHDEEDPEWEERQSGAEPAVKSTEISRNQKCPCGSGRKYKNCCLKNQNQHADGIPF